MVSYNMQYTIFIYDVSFYPGVIRHLGEDRLIKEALAPRDQRLREGLNVQRYSWGNSCEEEELWGGPGETGEVVGHSRPDLG